MDKEKDKSRNKILTIDSAHIWKRESDIIMQETKNFGFLLISDGGRSHGGTFQLPYFDESVGNQFEVYKFYASEVENVTYYAAFHFLVIVLKKEYEDFRALFLKMNKEDESANYKNISPLQFAWWTCCQFICRNLLMTADSLEIFGKMMKRDGCQKILKKVIKIMTSQVDPSIMKEALWRGRYKPLWRPYLNFINKNPVDVMECKSLFKKVSNYPEFLNDISISEENLREFLFEFLISHWCTNRSCTKFTFHRCSKCKQVR